MVIRVLASSSEGNCHTVSDGSTTLLLECGIPFKGILRGVEYKLSGVGGCLVTHGHKDHCRAVPDLVKSGVDCYMSAGTAREMNISGYRIKLVSALKAFSIGTFKVLPFDVRHDAAEPFGFLLKSEATKKSLLYITDTCYTNYRFKSVDIIMIECNYITETLMSHDIPPALKNRIMKSHMSLDTALKFLRDQDLSRCGLVYLTHLSKEHADADFMRKCVARETGCQVIVA